MSSAILNESKESWGTLIRNLLILLAVIGGIAYSAFPIALAFGLLSQPESRIAVFLVGSICGELGAFALLVWLLSRRGQKLRDLGWGQRTTWQAILLALAIAMGYAGVTALNPRISANLLQFSSLKVLAVISAIVAGVVEETIFRGYVMTVLAGMGYSPLVQLLVSGIAFAVAHFYGFASPAVLVPTLGFTLVLGLALGAIYLIGKRSLTPVIISHVLIDLIIEPWLLLSFFVP